MPEGQLFVSLSYMILCTFSNEEYSLILYSETFAVMVLCGNSKLQTKYITWNIYKAVSLGCFDL